MNEEWIARIKRIEHRSITIMMIVVPIIHSVLDDVGITFGLALGGFLELFCFYLLRRVVEKIVERRRGDRATLVGFALAGKLLLLGLGIFLSLSFLPVSTIALLSGVGLIILAVLIEAILPESKV